MFPQSTILGPLFWIVMGLLYAFLILGARVWFKDLGFQMYWWKWLITAFWFTFLSITVAGGFTLFGENEIKAGYYFLGLFGMVSIVSGVGIWRLLSYKKK